MTKAVQIAAQVVFYIGLAALLGYFSASPTYTHFAPEQSLIKLSFRHGGARATECRRRTAAEIAALPANMRKPLDCPRERVPLLVELELDGDILYKAALPPTGLSRDGPSLAYQRFAVEPGQHRFVARMRDSRRTEGFDYVREFEVELAPMQSLAIDFHADAGGFVFQ